MSKQAYRETVFDDSTPFVEVEIKGLRHSHGEVFTLEGVQWTPLTPEQIGHMEQALGRSLHPAMIDDIAAVLRKWDILEVLAERTKLV